MKKLSLLFIILIISVCYADKSTLSCKNHNGEDVDWWVMLKFSLKCDGCEENFVGNSKLI